MCVNYGVNYGVNNSTCIFNLNKCMHALMLFLSYAKPPHMHIDCANNKIYCYQQLLTRLIGN